jgi:Cu+-exporting ATPase
LRELADLLDSIAYRPLISLDNAGNTTKKTDKSIFYKIGVSGFAFGNIMLMSFPEYLSDGTLQLSQFQTVFGWLNMLLALPVAFYAAGGYYESAWKGLKNKTINIDLPVSLGAIVLFIDSVYEVVSGTGSGYFDSLSGLIFFLLIGKWYQAKTYEALSFERDYKSYFPIAVTTLVDGIESILPLSKLQKGSRIVVRNQELIPADATLVRGLANIDYGFVTGEATPIRKRIGDSIFAGGRQVGEAIVVQVDKEVENSYLTQLWNQHSDQKDSQLASLIDKVSERFTVFILLVAFGAGGYWWFTDRSLAIHAFSSVLIVACPCALALSMPFALGSAMRIFGRKGFYIKKTAVVEGLTHIDTIVFDKTGTITQSQLAEVSFEGSVLSAEQQAHIRSLARNSTHPMSIVVATHFATTEVFPVENFTEEIGLGIRGKIDGVNYKLGSQHYVAGNTSDSDSLSSKVWVSANDKVLGSFVVSNKYREGLSETIRSLSQLEQHVLTGDHAGEKENLLRIFGAASQAHLHFDQKPEDKLNYVAALRKANKNVLMIGDGLNDAGALRECNVGISIADDIYHFSPACDAILESEQFAQLPKLIRFAKSSMRVVNISFVISFLYNALGLTIAVSGNLSPVVAAILMPLSSVTVVAFVSLGVYVASRLIFVENDLIL